MPHDNEPEVIEVTPLMIYEEETTVKNPHIMARMAAIMNTVEDSEK
jgi:hypothetical protein